MAETKIGNRFESSEGKSEEHRAEGEKRKTWTKKNSLRRELRLRKKEYICGGTVKSNNQFKKKRRAARKQS